MIDLLRSVCEQGLIYAVMALGIYISYSILSFPDLSVDGTFPLGAAVTAVMIRAGVNPWLCLPVAFAAGLAAGTVTGTIHVKLGVSNLLSGILVMTALYSINLTLAGTSMIAIFGNKTVFNTTAALWIPKYGKLLIVVLLTLVVKLLLDWYLKTKSGMILRACGANEQLVRAVSIDSGRVKIFGLALSNGFVALSGSLMCQYNQNFDITSGTGTMVIGLAAVIIGLSLLRRVRVLCDTTKVLLGSVAYYLCVSIALTAGLRPQLLKLMIAVLFLLVLIVNGKLLKGGAPDA